MSRGTLRRKREKRAKNKAEEAARFREYDRIGELAFMSSAAIEAGLAKSWWPDAEKARSDRKRLAMGFEPTLAKVIPFDPRRGSSALEGRGEAGKDKDIQ